MTAQCVLGCRKPLTDDDRVPMGHGAAHGTCAVLLAMRLRAAHVAVAVRACEGRGMAVVVEAGPAACPCGGKLDAASGLCEVCGGGACEVCGEFGATVTATPDGRRCLRCEEAVEAVADAEVRS